VAIERTGLARRRALDYCLPECRIAERRERFKLTMGLVYINRIRIPALMRYPRRRLLLLAASALIAAAPPIYGDDVIDDARKLINNARYKSVEMLEDAVQAAPARADYWTELLFDMERDQRFVAQCMSHEAQAATVRSPEIVFTRARLFDPSAALEILNSTRIPGHEEELTMTKEALSLGLFGLSSCSSLAKRLIDVGRWERADEVIRFAAHSEAGNPTFWYCKAKLLAKHGKFAEAIEAQRTFQLKDTVRRPACQSWVIGDTLLKDGGPAWAIQAFNNYEPDEYSDQATLVYAEALLESGDKSTAERLLEKCDRDASNLLRLSRLLENGKIDAADELGGKLRVAAKSWRLGFGEASFPPLAWAPTSLVKPYGRAISWLIKEFPDDAAAIRRSFGDPDAKPRHEALELVLPSSELIPQLIKKLEAAEKPEEQWTIRNSLAEVLQSAERYDDAAKVHGINVFAPRPSYYQEARFRRQAVEWCICKRRAEAMRYFAGHLERIIAARQTLYNIEGARSFPERIDGVPWLGENEIIGRLKTMDPGVLALVFEAIESNRPTDWDWTPYVSIIERIGAEQDTPILIDMITKLANAAEARAKEKVTVPEACYTEGESKLAAALNRALETLAKTKDPAQSRTDQFKFWLSWWDANAHRIIRGGRLDEHILP
jgi:hypothetical protein